VFAFETIKIAQPISHEGTENPTSAQRIHADAPASRAAASGFNLPIRGLLTSVYARCAR